MLESMTGFGRAFVELSDKKLTMEIKCLNSKQFELNLRLPNAYRDCEMDIRREISKALGRGKIDCTLSIETTDLNSLHKINKQAALFYMKQLQEIIPGFQEIYYLQMAMKMPAVFTHSQDELLKENQKDLNELVKKTLSEVKKFRQEEGEILCCDFVFRIQKIIESLAVIKPLEEERKRLIQEKLKTQLESLSLKIDFNRFEQELIYYFEKLDITEEKIRLAKHCEYFLEVVKEPGSQGKKLGFILQEISREINTLGAKSNHAELQKIVVFMKEEAEKVREQISNIL